MGGGHEGAGSLPGQGGDAFVRAAGTIFFVATTSATDGANSSNPRNITAFE